MELIEKLDLGSREDIVSIKPLSGGVSSDIAVVGLGETRICAKFALEQLRVAEAWHVPVRRNGAEYEWLAFAVSVVAGAAPELFGRDADLNGFAMEFVEGDDTFIWKAALLDRMPSRGDAEGVARALGKIHAASTAAGFDLSRFQNQQDFYDLRLEPYLAFTAMTHPSLAAALYELIDSLQGNSAVLIHGDVSPKNILFRGRQPVFLDAECATMGDPGFDVAFCLNHLILKSFHMPDQAVTLLSELKAFWAAYAEHVSWEETRQLETRVSKLLPALMLARIDGKSPVEYLVEQNRDRIREFSIPLVIEPPRNLEDLAGRVDAALAE